MDFTNQGRPATSRQETVSHAPAGHGHSRRHKTFAFLKLATVTLWFSGTILIVALLLSLVFFKGRSESRLVDDKKWQVVVIGDQQAPYFGKIKEVNDRYIRLIDIYYFKANTTVQPDNKNQQQDISLVKLGCEIHGPQDQMVIRRDDVVYWENLKDDGQVAKAIASYKQQNPNGQQCNTQTSNTTTPTPAPTPTPSSSTKKSQ